MEALLFTLGAACVLWVSEILMLAKNDWTVSRSTPVSNLLDAQGSSFCNVFWGSSAVYLIGALGGFGVSHLLVNLVAGIAYLWTGIVSEQGTMIIGLLIASSLVSTCFGIKWLVTQTYTKVKGKVESTEFKRVDKQTKAMKEVYKVFKDKYCPIIK